MNKVNLKSLKICEARNESGKEELLFDIEVSVNGTKKSSHISNEKTLKGHTEDGKIRIKLAENFRDEFINETGKPFVVHFGYFKTLYNNSSESKFFHIIYPRNGNEGGIANKYYYIEKLDQEGYTIFKQVYLDTHIDDEIKEILGRINLTFPKGNNYKKIEDMLNATNEFTAEKIINYLDDYISEFASEPNPINLSKIGDVNFLRKTLTDYFELKK